MLETLDVSGGRRVQAVYLPRVRRRAIVSGSTALLGRSIIVIAGSRFPCISEARLACRVARIVARAGFVVAATAQTSFGGHVLRAADRAGAPLVGVLHTEWRSDFAPPVPAPVASALWLSIFGSRGWLYEGPDAADRLLGELASAVIVVDARGLPDAFYATEAALHAGSPVLFSREAFAQWPASLERPGVLCGASRAAILRMLAGLPPVSAVVGHLSADTPHHEATP